MRLLTLRVRLLLVFALLVCLLLVDCRAAAAGPLKRMRERRAAPSACGSAQSAITASGCGSAAQTGACGGSAVTTAPPRVLPPGTTFTDAQGNVWQLVPPKK